jgi:hypothetical protein
MQKGHLDNKNIINYNLSESLRYLFSNNTLKRYNILRLLRYPFENSNQLQYNNLGIPRTIHTRRPTCARNGTAYTPRFANQQTPMGTPLPTIISQAIIKAPAREAITALQLLLQAVTLLPVIRGRVPVAPDPEFIKEGLVADITGAAGFVWQRLTGTFGRDVIEYF